MPPITTRMCDSFLEAMELGSRGALVAVPATRAWVLSWSSMDLPYRSPLASSHGGPLLGSRGWNTCL